MVSNTAQSGSIGAGQQDPVDASSDFWWVSFIVSQMMAQLETSLPVQVIAVNPGAGSPPAAGTVDVQLLVSLLDGDLNPVQQGIVHGLPFFRLQGGPWAVVCDPAKDDFGWIVAAARDITSVKAKPGVQNPASLRQNSYSDGIYVGGCLNAVPAATLWLKPDGTWVWSDKPGNVLQSGAGGINLTTVAGGDFTVNGISVTKHTHAVAGVELGGGDVETGEPVG